MSEETYEIQEAVDAVDAVDASERPGGAGLAQLPASAWANLTASERYILAPRGFWCQEHQLLRRCGAVRHQHSSTGNQRSYSQPAGEGAPLSGTPLGGPRLPPFAWRSRRL